MREHCNTEPDITTALTWWSELPAKWIPVGWKDHLFRFNVLYNGMISAIPDLNPRTKDWQGQGLQLGVFPAEKPGFPGHVSDPQDNGSVVQGWKDCETPVLWSEWAFDGILFREKIFGHIPGGKAVETGAEPLFAWIRLSVYDVIEGLPLPEVYGFNLNINAPYMSTGAMSIRYNIAVDRSKSKYPRHLAAENETYDPSTSLRILEPDGKVRLAIAPGQDCETQVFPDTPTERDYLIWLPLKLEKGSHVDILLPMLPTEREAFDKELALGYDKALEEAERFWSKRPSTAAVFDVPETYINETIEHSIKLTEMIAERDPNTGFYSLLTGSWVYADLWATPGCLQCALVLDNMGYHSTVEKYLRMYIDDQGSVIPQGDFFKPHPGSFGPPKSIAACDWTSDHGSVLWAISQHALITGDKDYIDLVTEPVAKACEYIQFLRRIDGHGGVPGLMPPGVATDMPTKIQSVWADAWNYKGLTTAVRFLKRINHPRVDEFADEATDYKRVFTEALREQTEKMPEWTDDDGVKHHLVPLAVYGAQAFEYRNSFYLDTGPLALVFAGLLDADDPMMSSTLKWFREGPPAKVYRYDSDCWQIPSLYHEMSSCEPCFSWNLWHSHQSGDRKHFLEGMYSLFTGMISRQTHVSCETRGGVTGICTIYTPFFAARNAVIDDQINENELHLMRLMPLAWLSSERETRFENMPTEFGPVTLLARLSKDSREFHVSFQPHFRIKPDRVILHIPPVKELERVIINGKVEETVGVNRLVEISV